MNTATRIGILYLVPAPLDFGVFSLGTPRAGSGRIGPFGQGDHLAIIGDVTLE